MTTTVGVKSGQGMNTGTATELLPRLTVAGIDCVGAGTGESGQFSLTVKMLPGERLLDTFNRLALALQRLEATILKMLIFGSTKASPGASEALRCSLGPTNWPVTWVEGASCDAGPIAGIQVFVLAGSEVRRIRLNERVVGSVFEADGARHCVLGGVNPQEIRADGGEQTRQVMDNLQAALRQAGFTFADAVRTWFFLDDILSWYPEFNRARTQWYSPIRFRSGSLPASTGVAGRNPSGSMLVAGAWAVQPIDASVKVQEVASPLQCSATAYGSSFSRATEIQGTQSRRLFISGTASVGMEGETAHVGEAREQISLAMKAVGRILESRGMSFADAARAVAYFSTPANASLFDTWLLQHELGALPVVCVCCDICRPELLFEIEVDAVRRVRDGSEAEIGLAEKSGVCRNNG